MTVEDREKIRLYLDRLQPLPFTLAALLWDELEAQERRGEKALAKRRRYLDRRQNLTAAPPAREQPE